MSHDKELDQILEGVEKILDLTRNYFLSNSLSDFLAIKIQIAFIKGYIKAHKDLSTSLPDTPPF